MNRRILPILLLSLIRSNICLADGITPINMKIIAHIESSNDCGAINGQAMGLYQITPIALLDYNRQTKSHIKKSGLFNCATSKKIASWMFKKRIPKILKSKNKPITKENLIIGFNCGVGCVGKPLPKETRNYLIRYEKLERALCTKENGLKSSRLD